MPALAILGSNAATAQGKKKRYERGGGESEVWPYRGPTEAVEALYESFKNAALIDPTIAVVEFDRGNGIGTLVVTKASDQALLGVSTENGITKIYELLANEFSKRPELAPVFNPANGTPISNDQIRKAYRAHLDSTVVDEADAIARYGLSDDYSINLFRLLEQGIEEYMASAYVLRETKVVSGRNALRANFTNINRVTDPPDNSSANTLIGPINLLGGEWLKKAPNIRQISRTKWTVVTEWWWADQWSELLYGGSL